LYQIVYDAANSRFLATTTSDALWQIPIATTDPKLSDLTQFNGLNYDEYNVSGLDTFRQVNFSLDRPLSVTGFAGIRVVNTATGAVLAERRFCLRSCE
jgi:hypothetical protein